ncbi:chromosome segregation in meiosis-protein [Aspergillus pseudoviridinutans]|uniref:Chromosome segregation in meiosis protein n=1 Tax=Aspergillus pseudoviridinutans TaxID=1517512 RepID=A0A9P3B3A1_9EURO|nr:chromosome segregation in meiosis-protein [Aspergillus pseudoviridinutans]GIJ82504.1 chromosome segregation in meiosis-protein [Aspergillus pseudoviridinutans]
MVNEGTLQDDRPASPNRADDLFDYDFGLDELWQETLNTPSNGVPMQSSARDESGLGLGLDEEVKVTKKRQPVAKLDESRLLSQPGIPKLRRTAKKKLRFKGKGHEFSDAARLLNFYQLWLDDLFPRAKFADGLAIIERLGHSKRLQAMRKEWIDEDKPKVTSENHNVPLQVSESSGSRSDDPVVAFDGLNMTDTKRSRGNIAVDHTTDAEGMHIEDTLDPSRQRELDEGLFMTDDDDVAQQPDNLGAPDDDELDALLKEQELLLMNNAST